MPLTIVEKNALADFLASRVSWLSLHTANPAGTGLNEVATRVAVSWSSATAGIASPTADVLFTVPASITVSYVGLWTASTGGTFRGYIPLATSVAVPAGASRLIQIPLSSIGLSINATVTAA